jgi:hypothetical protein
MSRELEMREKRVRSVVVGACVALGLGVMSALGACSHDGQGASPASGDSTIPPPGTYTVLDPADVGAQKEAVDAASQSSKDVVDKTKDALGLQPVEAACVTVRLDSDPGLRDGLGVNPATSPRYQDLSNVAAECIRTTSGAVNFANSIQSQDGGALSGDQLGCLRDGYAHLSADDVGAIVRNGLNPGSTVPEANQKLEDLLSKCGIDAAKLPH